MTRKCHVRFVGGHTEKGTKVHLAGCLPNPIWSGVWLAGTNPGEMPSEAAANPTTCKVLKTAAGHVLLFEDAPDGVRVILASAGDLIFSDGAGSEIRLTGGAIRIQAAGQVLINS